MNSIENQPLSADELKKINAYWRAANYLSVEPLAKPIKPKNILSKMS
jgi:phosphoketolase